jgi:hypothetical protein
MVCEDGEVIGEDYEDDGRGAKLDNPEEPGEGLECEARKTHAGGSCMGRWGFACLSEIWKLGRRVERGVSMFLLYALLLCRQLKWCYELMKAGIGTITFTAEHNSTAPYSPARTYITQHNITSSWAFIAPRLALSPQSANELRPA